ncbi:MAG: putative bifunctional diguanylate cyclase/phosphodiesterase, partial [Beijerinckiaceae bacterium]
AHLLLFVFMLPFLVTIRSVARSLQRLFLNAIFSSHEASVLANRFDAALSNLPNGLSMFDEAGRLVVANPRWAQYLNVDPKIVRFGWTLEKMVAEYIARGSVSAEQGEAAMAMLGSPSPGLHAEKRNGVAIADRIFNITSERLANGGFLTMLEDITAQFEANARLAHMARFDALTGLPNRMSLQERIDAVLKAQRKDDPFAILFVDVDNFKHVNDTLGHAVGDALLFEVADRISAQLRAQDVVARFAGDEFVVLQRNCASPDEAAALANRVIETLGQPYTIDDHEIVAGASIGIALAPRDGMTVEMLFKKADMALYRAKASGRNAFSFFEDEMDMRAQARRAIEIDMRAALKANAFEPFFQPLYNIKTNNVTVCEALVRWSHPQKGMISPGAFIPLAEENGMIVEIGAQVLRKACAECKQWPDHVNVSVNISPVQIKRSDVVDLVARTLQDIGLDADRLEIEITESALLHDMEFTVSVLERLRKMGVRIALDDFGTGYSSLSHLRNLPLNKVKIDRAFLANIETDIKAQNLLRGMSQLSADLGMTVVIEGVETFQQLQFISSAGIVDEVQGFLFSMPVPASVTRKLLREPTVMPARMPSHSPRRAIA